MVIRKYYLQFTFKFFVLNTDSTKSKKQKDDKDEPDNKKPDEDNETETSGEGSLIIL